MTRLAFLLLPAVAACEPPTIDGLRPADDPDLQYIEWVSLPVAGADRTLLETVIADSDRSPVVFVGASWCGSCKAYKATLDGDTMKAVHGSVQILELDLDHHKALLAELNIQPAGVPHWEAVDASGRSVGVRVDGRAFPTDTKAEMVPVLTDFFGRVSGG